MTAHVHTLRVVSLQLGPIGAEVGVVSAVKEDSGGDLVTLCQHTDRPSTQVDPSRIRRVDFCPDCKNDDKATFVKGRPNPAGGFTIVNVTQLEEVKPTVAQKKTIPLTVHPAAQLNGLFFSGKAYYLAARGATASTYALLAQVMSRNPDLGFLGEFSFGGAPALYQVLESDGMLMMRQVARPETVQARPEAPSVENETYLSIAEQAARMVCTDYDPADYRDRRAELLARIIDEATPTATAGDLGAVLLSFVEKHTAKKAKTTAKKTTAKKTVRKAS